jgi:hypothetical protein
VALGLRIRINNSLLLVLVFLVRQVVLVSRPREAPLDPQTPINQRQGAPLEAQGLALPLLEEGYLDLIPTKAAVRVACLETRMQMLV